MPEREMLFREAIAEAMREEMQHDSSVFLIVFLFFFVDIKAQRKNKSI